MENKKSTFDKTDWVVFVVFCAAAALVRLAGLSVNSLWFDEVLTAHDISGKTLHDCFSTIMGYESTPFLFFIIERAVVTACGHVTEWTLRLWPAIAGSLACGVYFLLFCKIGSRSQAILAALLLTLSSFYLGHAQNARSYSQLILFAVSAMYCTVLWLQNPQKKRYLMLLGLFVFLSVQTHFYAMSFFCALTFATLLYCRKNRKMLMLAGTIAASLAVSFALVLPTFLTELSYQSGGNKEYLTQKWLAGIPYTPVKTLLGSFLFKIHSLHDLAIAETLWAVAITGILLVAAFIFVSRMRKKQVAAEEVIMTVTMATAFAGHCFVASKMPTLHPTYTAHILVFLFGFIVLNLCRRTVVSVFIVGGLLVLNGIGIYKLYKPDLAYMDPWKSIGEQVHKSREEQNVQGPVLAEMMTAHTVAYYLPDTSPVYVPKDFFSPKISYRMFRMPLSGHFIYLPPGPYTFTDTIAADPVWDIVHRYPSCTIVTGNQLTPNEPVLDRLEHMCAALGCRCNIVRLYRTNQQQIVVATLIPFSH